ncbi:ParA family protein [Alphaproteobacteria bacterium]|jgi:chromosome partitioning protein|nr:ParA family protein [Alphaproteobacteria bacterium]MDA9055811.1 ParA family protein [Alphaproteobacteria bacterium]MDG2489281.1 ParA family protein [Alphaproteobacteria bacterium]
MASQIAKAIFVGNIKGGVGKSTLTVYLTDYLRRRFKRRSVVLLDTDPQGTSFELMEPKSKNGDARFLPVGDRYDGVNMTTLDGVLRRLLAQNDGIAMVDTGAGKLGNFWQMAFLCNTLLVPTSMSWADLRPTIDFIKEIDERKADLRSVTPHVVVVPNRVSPQQRHFQQIVDALQEVNAILAPPISELSAARHSSPDFSGLEGVEGTRFCREIERLGEFIVEYVISGELDRIYDETAN